MCTCLILVFDGTANTRVNIKDKIFVQMFDSVDVPQLCFLLAESSSCLVASGEPSFNARPTALFVKVKGLQNVALQKTVHASPMFPNVGNKQ